MYCICLVYCFPLGVCGREATRSLTWARARAQARGVQALGRSSGIGSGEGVVALAFVALVCGGVGGLRVSVFVCVLCFSAIVLVVMQLVAEGAVRELGSCSCLWSWRWR